VKFLQRKIEEYEALKIEIEQLKNELALQKAEESE
jgi:regulator of replication initiation timing